MKPYTIVAGGKEYIVEPALHEGYYSVSREGLSVLIAKDIEGHWSLTLPDSEAADFPVKEIGKEIERVIRSEAKTS